MALHIKIEKFLRNEFEYCYKVETSSLGGIVFYIKIISNRKELIFSGDPNFENLLRIIDVNYFEDFEVPGLPLAIVGLVLRQVRKAFKEDNFSDRLDFCA